MRRKQHSRDAEKVESIPSISAVEHTCDTNIISQIIFFFCLPSSSLSLDSLYTADIYKFKNLPALIHFRIHRTSDGNTRLLYLVYLVF